MNPSVPQLGLNQNGWTAILQGTSIPQQHPANPPPAKATNWQRVDLARSEMTADLHGTVPASQENNAQPGQGCDCRVSNEVFDRPLCNDTTQEYAKAYPGTRFLEVLRDYGDNSIVASICPKNPNCTDPTDVNCGYNPAVAAIIDRLKDALKGTCLPRQLATDSDGQVLCRIFEVTRQPDLAPCRSDLPGRTHVERDEWDSVLSKLRALDICGNSTTPCSEFSVCKLTPAGESFEDPAYQECLHANDANIETATGYCYIDAMSDRNQNGVVNCTPECYAANSEDCDCVGNPEQVAQCDASQRRRLRFVSPPDSEAPVPWPNSQLFVTCNPVPFRYD